LVFYGVRDPETCKIVPGAHGSSMKTNPIVRTNQELPGIVEARL